MIRRHLVLTLALSGVAAMATPAVLHANDEGPPSAVRSQYGRAVAIAGDWAFIGEPGGSDQPGNPAAGGVVWVFNRGLPNAWQQSATLTLPGADVSAGFGAALAAEGDLLLVGHVTRSFGPPSADDPAGMVHVFTRGANGYTSSGVLPAPTASGARFGTAIAIAGNMAFVGAPGQGGGMVHIFERSASGWTAAGTITAEGLSDRAGFGSAISIDGDRVAIGAPGQDGKGAAYVFTRGATGWTQESTAGLASRRSSDNANFGATLLLKGDRLLVGAPSANFAPVIAPEGGAEAEQPNRRRMFGGVGMVVTFQRGTSGTWYERGLFTAYDFPTVASFGASMAQAGDELWVGAPSAGGSGEIYRVSLDENGNVASMGKVAVDSVGGRGAQFGGTVAIAGNRAIVGMPGDISGEGTVLFLDRAPGGAWRTVATAFPPLRDRFEMVSGKEVVCADGQAGVFQCGNTGLLSFLPISKVGGGRGSRMSDNWGWTDPETGREYAIAGRNDGTSFVDITDPENPRYLGDLPLTDGANPAAWRDMKTYKNHVYIVADGSGQHGMQVFDLTRLRSIRTPQTFTPDLVYDRIASAHNIVINEETGYAYSVGGSAGGEQCDGGLHMIDIREPKNPTFVGCAADGRTGRRGTGYSHDAVCIVYKGPDAKYQGREICVGSNETALSIQDVTDKKAPVFISSASYPFVSYAHQGWFTEDHKHFFLNDESDEIAAQRDTTGQNMAAKGTRTMVYDVTDLDDPVLVKEYIGTVRSSDHNLYVKGNKLYLSNYGSGLRIADISDPTNPREVAYLDTYPDDENQPQMVGAWSTYPYFASGTIIVTSVSEGLFLIKDRSQAIP